MSAQGTMYYMAPEVLSGRYGPKADVYSLGVMLSELLVYFMDCGDRTPTPIAEAPARPIPRADVIDAAIARVGSWTDMCSLVLGCTEGTPADRFTATEALGMVNDLIR